MFGITYIVMYLCIVETLKQSPANSNTSLAYVDRLLIGPDSDGELT